MKNKRKLFKIVSLIGAILLVLAVIFYQFRPNFFAPGMFQGGDEAAHMFLPMYAVDYFKAHLHFPIVNPYWYNGTEAFHHTPYLVYLPVALIYLLTGDIYLTNRVFTLCLLLLAGLIMFFFIRKKASLNAAIVGGILFPFSLAIFYLARTSITRAVPFILMPLVLYLTEEILEKKFNFKTFLYLVLLFAVMIFSHPVVTVTTLIFLGLYCVIRIFIDKNVSFNKLILWFGALILASGLVAWYAIPFLMEPANYSYPAGGIFGGISGVANRMVMLVNLIPLFLLALVTLFKQRTPRNRALIISLIFALLGTTSLSAPLYNFIPWVYPMTGIGWIIFILIYFASQAFDFFKIEKGKFLLVLKAVASAIFIIVCLFVFKYNYNPADVRTVWVEPFENAFPMLNQAFSQIKNQGRVFLVKNYYKIDWVVPVVNGKYFTEGHYYSITRFNKEIAWMNDAFNNGYFDYLISRMKLSNDRFFIVTKYLEKFLENNPKLREPFYASLEKDGFKSVFDDPLEPVRSLYYKDEPPNDLLEMSAKTLVIGQYAYNYAALDPNSYIAGSIYLDDYDLNFLSKFDNLVLYGFGYRDKKKAEKLVEEFAKNGGRVTIDLLNVKHSPLETEDIFLGVQSNLAKTTSPLKIESPPDSLLPRTLELPSELTFGVDDLNRAEVKPLKEWRFTEYYNLDNTLARSENRQEEKLSLVGSKDIGQAKVWFLGGNLIYHAYLTHGPAEQAFVRQLSTGSKEAERLSVESGDITILGQNIEPEAGRMEFDYLAEKDRPLLISYTISPHWKAYLDGVSIPIYNVESMMALNLPAGNHNVKLKYENLPTHIFAKVVTIATLALIIIFFYFRKKRKDVQKT